MQEIYLFISQTNSKQKKGVKMKNKKNNLVNYIFALGAFILVMFLAFNSLEKNQKTYVNNEVKDSKSLTEYDFGKTDNNITNFSIWLDSNFKGRLYQVSIPLGL